MRMARFYVLAIEPALFGQYALVREFGRTGHGGRIMSEFFDTAADAVRQLERQRRVKERRGYAEHRLIAILSPYGSELLFPPSQHLRPEGE